MKKDTKKNTKKYMTGIKIFIILVLVVFFVIIAPFLLNKLYDLGCPFITVWQKEDLIGYYGSVIAAATAIVGVYFTLDYSKFKQMEYEKLRVKPYINFEIFHYEANVGEHFTCEEDEIYIYKDLEKNYIEICEGRVPEVVKQINKNNDKINILHFYDRTECLNISLQNVGADSAIRIRLYLNDEIIYREFSLIKGGCKKLKLVADFGKDLKKNMIDVVDIEKMDIIYENIYGNQLYRQSGTLKIQYVAKTGNYNNIPDNDFFGKQIEINN